VDKHQREFNLENGITNPEYVLLHAPETINESSLGVDTIELIRKIINEWIKE
jgi:hypothetical protein